MTTEKEIKQKLENGEVTIITIKVTAGAKKNSIEITEDGIIKVKINKPAVEGKANKAIIEYFSEIFDLPKKNISILKGEKSSVKNLQITPKKHII